MRYDFLVIGGGSAGYAAARTACDFGAKVAVVDGSSELGGLCILKGCMPSKTLIYSAEALHMAKMGSVFGLDIPEAKADLAAMQARKKEVIREFAEYRQGQLEDGRFDLYRATATFVDSHTVKLFDDSVLEAEKILVATGSTVNLPHVPGLFDVPVRTSDDVLELSELPEEVLVLGGGVVACELAQYLVRVGARVTIVQRSPRLLKEFSPEASQVVEQAFRDEGAELFLDTELHQVENLSNGSVRVHFGHAGERVQLDTGYLFNALGRIPSVGSLDLVSAGIKTLPTGHLRTNSYQQTTAPNVYAAGDCSGPHEIVHIAIRQGETAASHALGHEVAPMNYDGLLSVVFTDPQVAYVGLSLSEIEARGISCASASFPFDDHGKSILMEAKRGHVAIHASKEDGRILGAECVGKDAGELIHSISVAIALKATAHDLLKADWYHPTLSEIWTYPLEDVAEECLLS
jgi:pyruvate/2-oxoglutarate dehydrogenase complex dihydrolipoamide dehydrogenase (E3) component